MVAADPTCAECGGYVQRDYGKISQIKFRRMLCTEHYEEAKIAEKRSGMSSVVLCRGDTGPDVRDLQKMLKVVKPDGIFGPLTEQAVRHWQTSQKTLTVDGRAGPETLASLNAHATVRPFDPNMDWASNDHEFVASGLGEIRCASCRGTREEHTAQSVRNRAGVDFITCPQCGDTVPAEDSVRHMRTENGRVIHERWCTLCTKPPRDRNPFSDLAVRLARGSITDDEYEAELGKIERARALELSRAAPETD